MSRPVAGRRHVGRLQRISAARRKVPSGPLQGPPNVSARPHAGERSCRTLPPAWGLALPAKRARSHRHTRHAHILIAFDDRLRPNPAGRTVRRDYQNRSSRGSSDTGICNPGPRASAFQRRAAVQAAATAHPPADQNGRMSRKGLTGPCNRRQESSGRSGSQPPRLTNQGAALLGRQLPPAETGDRRNGGPDVPLTKGTAREQCRRAWQQANRVRIG